MDANVQQSLEQGGVVDITTTGRKSGLSRRIEISFHHLDGEFFITGKPGRRRDWLANLVANPGFTLHLKRGVQADPAAAATEITDPDERAAVIYRILTESWNSPPEQVRSTLNVWVEGAPLIRFSLA